MRFMCLLAQYSAFILSKMQFPGFLFPQAVQTLLLQSSAVTSRLMAPLLLTLVSKLFYPRLFLSDKFHLPQYYVTKQIYTTLLM